LECLDETLFGELHAISRSLLSLEEDPKYHDSGESINIRNSAASPLLCSRPLPPGGNLSEEELKSRGSLLLAILSQREFYFLSKDSREICVMFRECVKKMFDRANLPLEVNLTFPSSYNCHSNPIVISGKPISARIFKGFFLNGVKSERVNVIVKLYSASAEYSRELSNLRKLQSVCVVTLLDNSTSERPYIVLEEFGQALNRFFPTKMTSSVQLMIANQILSAISWFHDQQFVHCDLKPENILVADKGGGYYGVKLCDFENSKKINDSFPSHWDPISQKNVLLFTRLWVCPEVYLFNREILLSSLSPAPLSVEPQMDVFCVGLVLLCLLSSDSERKFSMAVLPDSEEELQNFMTKSSYIRNKILLALPSEYHELLLSLCDLNHSLRGSLAEVLDKFSSLSRTGIRNELLIQTRVNETLGRKVENIAEKADLREVTTTLSNEIWRSRS
jgi:serine/threonine protein kinase